MRSLAVSCLLLGLTACRAPEREPASSAPAAAAPYALLLGIAQDGGRPQLGCRASCCAGRPHEPVTALLVVDPRAGTRFLIDATPDLAAQLAFADKTAPIRVPDGARAPLFDGLFLTHAHMGHYAGLLQLGSEAYGARGAQVWASARMAAFLRANAPWNALFAEGGATLRELVPGEPVALGEGLALTPFLVPHRDEYSDTLAFRIEGPRRALLFAPDTDGWERWDPPVEARLAAVDFALLDATFFDADEVPGRDLSSIPHPFLRASIARFSALDGAGRAKLRFVHLNHTNPAFDPGSAASAELRAAGLRLGHTGERFEL